MGCVAPGGNIYIYIFIYLLCMLLLTFYSVVDEWKCVQYRWNDTDRGIPKYLTTTSGAVFYRGLPA
jgi:hypothetical protein